MSSIHIGRDARPSVRKSLVRITWGGCLAVIFFTGITCPASTKFFLAVGANEFHFGLLGGIPMGLLAMQFVGAVLTNHVQRRKPIWMFFVIVGRFAYLPVVLIPLLFPTMRGEGMMTVLIGLIVLSAALRNMCAPMWFAWMADLVPKPVLNHYWGNRQRWMQLTWVVAYLAVAAIVHKAPWSVMVTFPTIAAVGIVAGVVDITLFLWVREPQNVRMDTGNIRDILLAPIRDRQYRMFLIARCFRAFAVMFAAAFMQLYAFEILGFTVLAATLAWCASGLGNAVSAKLWGKIADKHGHRPILTICSAMKPFIPLVFLLVTPGPWAPWIIGASFFVDGFWNAGNMVAENGFMMKIAPRKNRSMFVAAIWGLAGLAGGASAIMGGWYLKETAGYAHTLFGRTWNNYHVLFLVSVGLRTVAAILMRWVHEPESSRPVHVILDILGTSPIRFFRSPVGFYRRNDPQ